MTFAIKGGIGIDGIVKTLIIAMGREEIFFSSRADSIAFAAEDYFFRNRARIFIKYYSTNSSCTRHYNRNLSINFQYISNLESKIKYNESINLKNITIK